MNITSTGNTAAPSQSASTVDRRAQLQMMLLKTSLDLQQAETAAVMQQLEGKGQTIDIRV